MSFLYKVAPSSLLPLLSFALMGCATLERPSAMTVCEAGAMPTLERAGKSLVVEGLVGGTLADGYIYIASDACPGTYLSIDKEGSTKPIPAFMQGYVVDHIGGGDRRKLWVKVSGRYSDDGRRILVSRILEQKYLPAPESGM